MRGSHLPTPGQIYCRMAWPKPAPGPSCSELLVWLFCLVCYVDPPRAEAWLFGSLTDDTYTSCYFVPSFSTPYVDKERTILNDTLNDTIRVKWIGNYVPRVNAMMLYLHFFLYVAILYVHQTVSRKSTTFVFYSLCISFSVKRKKHFVPTFSADGDICSPYRPLTFCVCLLMEICTNNKANK